jgi:hypothetical protein
MKRKTTKTKKILKIKQHKLGLKCEIKNQQNFYKRIKKKSKG